ncbi:MAG: type I-E CRISPR-associated protein Cas7/Cse4/CasC [Litorilinea sp.]
MFVELHMIQNFVPSNLNRDDTGSPKDCEFGGYRRARISSQCLKRSIRTHPVFSETTKMGRSKRTHYLASLLYQSLHPDSKQLDQEVKDICVEFAHAYTTKPGKPTKIDKNDPEKTAILAFITPDEVAEIAATLRTSWDALIESESERKKTIQQLVKSFVKATQGRVSAPDVALFGRMLTSHPSINLDAACQVAHAISTHRVSMEMDYFTAVDDVREANEEAGAGHINTFGFNSSCFYRYARIDWRQLLKNLGDDKKLAQRAVEGFLRAALVAVPSGKQNSTAPLNPASFVLAVVRTDGMGWNLANAFEKPVVPSAGGSIVQNSIAALDNYWGKLSTIYGDDTLQSIQAINLDGSELPNLGKYAASTQSEWLNAVSGALLADREEAVS